MYYGYFSRELPDSLADLSSLAFDLRWNNCPVARHLWSQFDHSMWERTENPFLVLQSAHQERIDAFLMSGLQHQEWVLSAFPHRVIELAPQVPSDRAIVPPQVERQARKVGQRIREFSRKVAVIHVSSVSNDGRVCRAEY